MDMEFRRREKIVGSFIIIVFLLLLSSLFILGKGKGWFERHISYYTVFDESYNLQKGAAVKLYNTEIGKVKKIIVTGDHVRVDLDILEAYSPRIKEDTIATVESPTFIGSEFVSIRAGGRSEARIINPGEQIPSQERQSISDILAEFQVEKTAKMLIGTVQDISEMIRDIKDPDGPIFTAMDTINLILKELQEGRGSIGSILKSDQLMDDIRGLLAEADKILKNLEKASGKSPESMDLVNQSLKKVYESTENISLAIEDIIKKVQEEMKKISNIMDNIEKAGEDTPSISKNVKFGLKEVRESLEELDKIVLSLQKNMFIRKNIEEEKIPEAFDADLR